MNDATRNIRKSPRRLRINLQTRQVWLAAQEIELTRLEYQVLEYLVRRGGQVVTYQELWREVWRHECPHGKGEQQTVRQAIKRLRVKLGDAWRTSQFLICVRGVGFRCKMNDITLVE